MNFQNSENKRYFGSLLSLQEIESECSFSAGVAIFALRETLRERTAETSQLQTFNDSQGFDRFTLFLFKSSPNDSFFSKIKRNTYGLGAL